MIEKLEGGMGRLMSGMLSEVPAAKGRKVQVSLGVSSLREGVEYCKAIAYL